MSKKSRELGLDVLCEAHSEEELHRALDSGCELIGVNNRDLRTFKVDVNTALRLAEMIPKNVVSVAESGIDSGADIARLRAAGYQAFLIGESLMKAESPGEALKTLLAEAEREGSALTYEIFLRTPNRQLGTGVHDVGFMTWIKICGTTNLEDALTAVDAGADALGFVFYEKSPRKIAAEAAREIVAKVPPGTEKVGVFVEEPLEKILLTVAQAGLTAAQLHGDQYLEPGFLQQLKNSPGLEGLPGCAGRKAQ